MRTISTATIACAFLAITACGGNSVSPGPTCGPGTILVNGQCVVDPAGGGGSGGGSETAGAGGQTIGNGGTSTGGGGGAGRGGSAIDGGGGAPVMDLCSGKDVVAGGSLGLLSSFEDHDIDLLPNDGRLGRWSLESGSGNCTLTPIPLLPETPVGGFGVNNASKYALHVTATGCGANGPSLATGLNVNNGLDCAYDATAYDGISFWATTPIALRVTVGVGLRTTIPAENGGDGSCAQDATNKGCWDRHSVSVDLAGDWQQYRFKWSQLQQQGWGTRAPWDVKLTADIAFLLTADQASTTTADYSIDNVGFFKDTPPTPVQ